MKNQIIIHAAGKQTRIALIENGELAQLFIESPENQRTVGDIYLAEVHKVMPGIRAAFIDLGTQKDAFLHFSDTGEHLENYLVMLNGKNALPSGTKKNSKGSSGNGQSRESSYNKSQATEDQDRAGALLAPRQRVLVQVVKEPIGNKGPRVSTNITLAGRYLVLIPFGDYIAVSKRIRSHKERRRLRSVVGKMLPEGFGVIVRTVAEDQKSESIHEDLKDVLDKWKNIQEKQQNSRPPALLHRDLDMTESLIRDLFAKDYDRLLVDDPKMYRQIKNYISRVAPNMMTQLELYKGTEHIFDYMKISHDVESVFSPRVKMPSGGYLIFEQTEAMYVVDVNSGRYAAKKEQEDNSLKTNLEAAREIAKQLRLRDIGGIIVVDFIDLRDDTNRKKVFEELRKEFRKDRAKTNVIPMSDFGLVQITRQRIRPSVVKSVSRICPMCGGSGNIVSHNTILADLEAWLSKFRYHYKYRKVDLHINPYLRSVLTRGLLSQRFRWILRYGMYINILSDESISLNDFKFALSGSDIDITDTVIHNEPIDEAIKASKMDAPDEPAQKKERHGGGLDYYKRGESDAQDKKPDKPESKQGRSRPPSARQKPPSRNQNRKDDGKAPDAGKNKAGSSGSSRASGPKGRHGDKGPSGSQAKDKSGAGDRAGTGGQRSGPHRNKPRDTGSSKDSSESKAPDAGAPGHEKSGPAPSKPDAADSRSSGSERTGSGAPDDQTSRKGGPSKPPEDRPKESKESAPVSRKSSGKSKYYKSGRQDSRQSGTKDKQQAHAGDKGDPSRNRNAEKENEHQDREG